MIKIDMWNGATLEEATETDYYFYANEGIFRGNIYNHVGEAIGDFTADNSVEMFETFRELYND